MPFGNVFSQKFLSGCEKTNVLEGEMATHVEEVLLIVPCTTCDTGTEGKPTSCRCLGNLDTDGYVVSRL